jgi:hypothetical protein
MIPYIIDPGTKPWLIASSGSIPASNRFPGKALGFIWLAISDTLRHG